MSTRIMHPDHRPAPAENHHHHATICVVDDSSTIRAIVRITLESLGYTVHTFADGSALWHWLAQQPALPALLLLDIELPTMDGYDLAGHLRRHPRYQAIPLVMLSSRDSVTDRLKARVAGMQAYLTKPFTVQHLHTVVQAVLHPGCLRPPTTTGTTRETH